MLELLSTLHRGRNKHRIDLYVHVCVSVRTPLCACMNLPENETRMWAYRRQSFLVVIDDASVAFCLENHQHIHGGQRRQDVLTGYVMRMTIKGLFCCLWIPLRCLQSWLRVQAFSTGHVTHACFFFFCLTVIIIVSVLGYAIFKTVTFGVVIPCSLVDGLEKLCASIFGMNTASSYEMLVTAYQTTWHHITDFSVFIFTTLGTRNLLNISH